jgi:hypothetical protein
MKIAVGFWDGAQNRVGLKEPLEDFSFDQASQDVYLVSRLYNEWGKYVAFTEEYKHRQRSPGLQA